MLLILFFINKTRIGNLPYEASNFEITPHHHFKGMLYHRTLIESKFRDQIKKKKKKELSNFEINVD